MRKIVLVTGGFDPIHSGHIEYFKAAKKLGLITILNPAPAKTLSKDFLENTDWLIPNAIEFEAISNSEPNEASMSDFAKKHGVGLVVTLGESGAALIDRSGKYFKIESEKVEVVDICGAGDTFIAGFTKEYLETNDVSKSIVFANKVASVVIQKKGVAVYN